MRRICIVTGSRADWGLLEPIYRALLVDCTVDLVSAWDCPECDARIKIDCADTEREISEGTAYYLAHFAFHYSEHRPDLVVLLGDRYEIFAAATAALIARIPIAHIHGGESTEGAFDEALRHSITKMSHLHFVATEMYRKRVIQLGEHPDRVFKVGALGADKVSVESLEVSGKNLVIVFHPVTLESDTAKAQMTELLHALSELSDTQLIFVMPNADPGNGAIRALISEFFTQYKNVHVFENLPRQAYLGLLASSDGIVGNSSSGLLEAPSLKKGCVNIGDRQKGRIRGGNVIDCEPTRESIRAAIEKLYSPEFQKSLETVVNPYGDGGATEKIVKVLCEHPLDNILKKSFYDLPAGV